MDLKTFFNPTSIAIIGVSENPKKVGYLVAENLIRQGYKGEIYFINPKFDKLFDRPVYKDIKDIGKPIDLVVLAVPADAAMHILDDLKTIGIHNIVLYAAGFKEAGVDGAQKEQNLVMKAKAYDMTILGPNCIGYVSTISNANVTFLKNAAPKGNVGFISQSGALGSLMVDYLVGHENFGFSYFMSLGNKATIDECDLLEFLRDDPDTKVIGMYLEDVKRGEDFKRILEETTKVKPVVILKSGSTAEGSKAAGSHTGSMVGDDMVYGTVFDQYGGIRAGQFFEFMSMLKIFSFGRAPTSKDILILSNAGGIGVLLTDELIKNKLELVTVPEDINIHNPIDLLGDASAFHYRQAIAATIQQKHIGGVVVMLTPQANTEVEDTASALIEAQSAFSKPIFPIFMGEKSVGQSHVHFERAKMASFFTYDFLPSALAKIVHYQDHIQHSTVDAKKEIEMSKRVTIPKKAVLNPMETNTVLMSAGLSPVALIKAESEAEVREMGGSIGYPLVLKIASETITHKTEVKGVRVNIQNEKELMENYHGVCEASGETSVYLQKMMKGHEFIIGAKRDRQFGIVILLGLGGIYAELISSAVSFIYPFSFEYMMKKIRTSKVQKIIEGFRGSAPVDEEKLFEIVDQLGMLMNTYPEIKEIDLNPTLVSDSGLHIVDGRMML
jgi:acetate---CoA ligase (ADP-forming)